MQGHNWSTKPFNHTLFRNYKCNQNFHYKKFKIFHKQYLLHIILLKGSFETKKFIYGRINNTIFFLQLISQKTFSLDCLFLLDFLWKLLDGLHQNVFANMLCQLFCNMILDLSSIIFLDSKRRHVGNDITNNTWFEKPQGFFEFSLTQ